MVSAKTDVVSIVIVESTAEANVSVVSQTAESQAVESVVTAVSVAGVPQDARAITNAADRIKDFILYFMGFLYPLYIAKHFLFRIFFKTS